MFFLMSASLIFFSGLIIYLIKKISNNYEFIEQKTKENSENSKRISQRLLSPYPNGWVPIIETNELRRGQVKYIFVVGHDLIVFRGLSGKVHVLDAYCPHLGANLGVGGTVVGDQIKCPFHGWQFNEEGQCTAIPGNDSRSMTVDKINKWHTIEVNDFIFIWNHSEGEDNEPSWFPSDYHLNDTFIYRGRIDKTTHCLVQDIFENVADFEHIDKVHNPCHAYTYTSNVKNLLLKYVFNFKSSEYEFDWKQCEAPNQHCANVFIASTSKLIENLKLTIKVKIRQFGAAHSITEFDLTFFTKFKFYFIISVITLEPLRQKIITRLYSEPSINALLIANIFLLPMLSEMLENDIRIWNSKRFVRNPFYTKKEISMTHFRRFNKQFYSNVGELEK